MKKIWLNMLDQQNTIHEAELVKWHNFIRIAVDLLENVKQIYAKFNAEINEVDESVKDEF